MAIKSFLSTCFVVVLLVIVYNPGPITSIKIEHIGVKIMSVPSKNVKNAKAFNSTNKNGDRVFSAQFTTLIDMSKNLMLNAKPYFDRKGKLVPAPIKVSPNVCEAFEKNTFNLRNIFSSSNLTDCPIKAGTYRLNNWVPDGNAMPSFPPGRYVVDMTFVNDGEEMATFRWWGGILKG